MRLFDAIINPSNTMLLLYMIVALLIVARLIINASKKKKERQFYRRYIMEINGNREEIKTYMENKQKQLVRVPNEVFDNNLVFEDKPNSLKTDSNASNDNINNVKNTNNVNIRFEDDKANKTVNNTNSTNTVKEAKKVEILPTEQMVYKLVDMNEDGVAYVGLFKDRYGDLYINGRKIELEQ